MLPRAVSKIALRGATTITHRCYSI